MAKRVIWIVLDSAGIGEEPDADKFGDVGSDTFGHILAAYPDAKFDNLTKLGLRAIENTSFYRCSNKAGCDRRVWKGTGVIQRQGYDNRTLGDDWDSYKTCIPDVSKMDSHRRLSMHLSSRPVVEPSTETRSHPAFRSLQNMARNT